MTKTPAKQFVDMVDQGVTPPPELLLMIADMLRKSGRPPKRGRNALIAVSVALLVSMGWKKCHAMDCAFGAFDGPKDERARARLLAKLPVTLLFSGTQPDEIELWWSADPDAHINFGISATSPNSYKMTGRVVSKTPIYTAVIDPKILGIDENVNDAIWENRGTTDTRS